MENLIQEIQTLLEKKEGTEPGVIGYSTSDKRLFCIPEHYPGTSQFGSDVINDIYYSNFLASLCDGDVKEVYLQEITESNRYKSMKIYFIDTANKDAASFVTTEHIWDWVR